MKTIKFYVLIFIVNNVLALLLFRIGVFSNTLLFYRGIIVLFITLLVTITIFHIINRKKNNFVSQYVYKNNAIERRISEQRISQNIKVSSEKIILSDQGKMALYIFNIIEAVYGI